MDKLRPLIRQRFWLLFGLALPLALAGYFLASGKMKAATQSREETLKSTLGGVADGDDEPNDKYAAALEEINKQLQEQNDVEVQKLWEAQTTRMHWPSVMVNNNYLPDEFRGDIKESARRYYTRVYPKVIQGVWEKAEPVVDDPPPPGLDVTWKRKVLLLRDTIPRQFFDMNLTPTNDQVWDAQEDVWLMELIFEGVARANREANWIGEAPLRRIDYLELTGGSGTSSVLATQGMGMGMGMGGDEFGMDLGMGMAMEDEFGEMMGMGAGPGGMVGPQGFTQGLQASVPFDYTEEFGPPVPKPAEGGADATAGADPMGMGYEDEFGMDMAMMDEFGGMMGGGMMGGGMMGGMMGAGLEPYRYIGEPSQVETAPYRERGFYMSVIMLLPELPEVMAALSSSDWPIRIGRIHIGPNPHAPPPGSSYGGPGGGFAAGRGMMGGGLYEDDEGFMMGGMGGGFGGSASMRGGAGRRGAASRLGGGNLGALASMAGTGIEDEIMGMGMGGGFGGGMLGGRGGVGAGAALPLPRSMQDPWNIDPEWFADPDLVQVEFCGIITMYNPVKDPELEPTADDSSVEEYQEAIEDQDVQLKEAAEQAAEEQANAADEASDADAAPPTDTAPAADSTADSTTENETNATAPPAQQPTADTVPQ